MPSNRDYVTRDQRLAQLHAVWQRRVDEHNPECEDHDPYTCVKCAWHIGLLTGIAAAREVIYGHGWGRDGPSADFS